MSEPKPLTALICDGDTWMRHTLGAIARDAGFEVIAETANIIEAIREVELGRPSLVVLTFDSMVMNPMSLLRELNPEGGTHRLVVLVTHDTSMEQRAKDEHAYAVAPQGDTAALTRTLMVAAHVLEAGDDAPFVERRSGIDRRQHQDWNKVISQRRHGGRRASDQEPTTGAGLPRRAQA